MIAAIIPYNDIEKPFPIGTFVFVADLVLSDIRNFAVDTSYFLMR